ncbi:MAG: hypothetical protein DSM107014_12245 [Gomphosphaeria aponina SAG 52.96 = DSM 107014]|uniref:Uncharacterized protein n=1 Tax=Gomphosphaeria aponina SAG 52.96 = DSM 107014 TaxID=1521640 RepID=A0A941GW88_9CHRO|nr:hypothetical protein [Gomphosphaeria aponina SAG 52.96 = DSM 107014]
MSTQDLARQLMAQERKHDENLHENMLNRAEQEVETTNEIEEKARELMAQERKHDENLQENMLNRAEQEVIK